MKNKRTLEKVAHGGRCTDAKISTLAGLKKMTSCKEKNASCLFNIDLL